MPIKRRIDVAKYAFLAKENILTSKKIIAKIKKSFKIIWLEYSAVCKVGLCKKWKKAALKQPEISEDDKNRNWKKNTFKSVKTDLQGVIGNEEI